MKSFPWDSIVQAMGDDGLPIYDRAYSAEDFRNVMQVFFSNGVFVNVTDALQVTAGENMTVNVAPGKALINGTTAWERESRTLEIVEAESNDRIDTVVLRWDANLEQRKIDLYVRQGVSSASPVRPNLTRTESVYELGLADIFIPKNTTSVSGERITDTRLESERCGIASPFMKIDTTTFYSQLEAALEKQTGELQEQTDRAVELAQSALDGTTAGLLMGKVENLENITVKVVPYKYINNDKPSDWSDYEEGITIGNCMVELPNSGSGELHRNISDGQLLTNITSSTDADSGEVRFSIVQIVTGTVWKIYQNGSVLEGAATYLRSGSFIKDAQSDEYDVWSNGGNWVEQIAKPANGSITEDMLSSGLKDSFSKQTFKKLGTLSGDQTMDDRTKYGYFTLSGAAKFPYSWGVLLCFGESQLIISGNTAARHSDGVTWTQWKVAAVAN